MSFITRETLASTTDRKFVDQQQSMCLNLQPAGGKPLGCTPTSRVATGWKEKGGSPFPSGTARKEPPRGDLRCKGWVGDLDECEHGPQPEGMGIRSLDAPWPGLQLLQDPLRQPLFSWLQGWELSGSLCPGPLQREAAPLLSRTRREEGGSRLQRSGVLQPPHTHPGPRSVYVCSAHRVGS